MPAYEEDLAWIHDAGFGHLARAAARALTSELAAAGIASGTVIELGCGSGISARDVADAGFEVVGFDISPAMLALARARVPNGRFLESSWIDAELPRAVAVTAIGEVLCYAFDERNDGSAWAGLFARVVGSSRVDLQACKLEYSIVSPK